MSVISWMRAIAQNAELCSAPKPQSVVGSEDASSASSERVAEPVVANTLSNTPRVLTPTFGAKFFDANPRPEVSNETF